MSLALVAGLVGLALLDSTSIGTLFIPLWLLLAPGPVRLGRLLVYLATIAGFYFLVGIALMAGADAVFGWFEAAWAEGGPLDTPLVNGLLLVFGAAMLLFSFRKTKPKDGPSRVARWRDRAMAVESPAGLMGLALLSATIEVATMLPYLGAIALVTATGSGWGLRIALLAFYCLVMVLPALVMIGLRVVLGTRIASGLAWFNAQMDRFGGEAALWIVGMAGVFLAAFGGSRLFDF